MIIGLIIVSVLLAISILINAFLISCQSKIINGALDDFIENLPRSIEECSLDDLSKMFGGLDQEYHCSVLLSRVYDSPFEGLSYDFSAYDNKKIIGVTQLSKLSKSEYLKTNLGEMLAQNYQDVDQDELIELLNEHESKPELIPNSIVYKFKDGTCLWFG